MSRASRVSRVTFLENFTVYAKFTRVTCSKIATGYKKMSRVTLSDFDLDLSCVEGFFSTNFAVKK